MRSTLDYIPRFQSLLVVVFWNFFGCNAQSLDQRNLDSNRVAPGTPVGSSGQQSGSGQGGTPQVPAVGSDQVNIIPDPANLPTFLHKRDEALALMDKLVEEYVKPKGDETALINPSNAFAASISSVDTFSKALFLKPIMKPGRTLTIFAVDDESLNASANGFQRVTINAGLFKVKNAPMTVSTLCHEMAHSTRNHVVKRFVVIDQVFGSVGAPLPAFKAVNDKINAYFTKQYNVAAGVYTHKRADYLPIKQEFETVTKELSQISRKNESEADVVGGFICAQAGMKSPDFIKGYSDFTAIIEKMQAAAGASTKAEDVADGKTFKISEPDLQDLVSDYFFRIETHPELKDRDAQLNRLKDLIDKKLDDKIQLYAELVKELVRAEGISLVETQPSEDELRKMMNVKTYASEDGTSSIIMFDPMGEPGPRLLNRFRP